MFDLEEELKKLPGKPGVYLMHSKSDEIIYVGKAISLKNRVRQYFQAGTKKTSKIQKMVSQIAYFEYIITDSELEALVLECNLIKEHQPKYNTMLKDDKSYPFIRVTLDEEFPRVQFCRRMKKDKNKYFGPYTSSKAVKETIELLQKIYKIRTCNKSLPKDIGKTRACLNYHMKQCDAPCQGYVTKEQYQKSVGEVMDFLNGNYKKVTDQLHAKMMEKSEQLKFEEAMEYRDLLNSVQQIAQKQRITNQDLEDRDIIAMAASREEAVVSIFFVREGKLLGREHFHMERTMDETRSKIITEFLKQYYSGTPFIPREIVLQEEPEEEETGAIVEWLSARREHKVFITVPKKGEKRRLVSLAEENASMILAQDVEKIKRQQQRTILAVEEIRDLLKIPSANRMEAFDISNTSGFQNVASMVVFEGGLPKKSDYRKFKIRGVKGPDDYQSMKEALERRFLRGISEEETSSFSRLPDLLLMDGGKGQVNVALKVLEELHLNIPVCGMVKDDKHRTRGLYYENKEINFPPKSEAFLLLTRIQDEAHRFAIEYHKMLRSKNQIHSVLDDIKGVGPARRKALMKHFKDIECLKEAGIDELEMVEGITPLVARNIYDFFHEKTDSGRHDGKPYDKM